MSWTILVEPAQRTVEFKKFEIERTSELDFSTRANFEVGQVWLNEFHEILNSKKSRATNLRVSFQLKQIWELDKSS